LADRYPFQAAEFEDIGVNKQSTGFLKPLTRGQIGTGAPGPDEYYFNRGVYLMADSGGYQLRFRVGGRLLTLSV
jgi:hypothetical protein